MYLDPLESPGEKQELLVRTIKPTDRIIEAFHYSEHFSAKRLAGIRNAFLPVFLANADSGERSDGSAPYDDRCLVVVTAPLLVNAFASFDPNLVLLDHYCYFRGLPDSRPFGTLYRDEQGHVIVSVAEFTKVSCADYDMGEPIIDHAQLYRNLDHKILEIIDGVRLHRFLGQLGETAKFIADDQKAVRRERKKPLITFEDLADRIRRLRD